MPSVQPISASRSGAGAVATMSLAITTIARRSSGSAAAQAFSARTTFVARTEPREITDSLALVEEGRVMRHCVRSYQDACVKGETSIWSLRVTLSDNPTLRRLLTIEVNNRRQSIVQVRGKCNQSVSGLRGHQRVRLARTVLRDWARQEHLGIACSL